MALRTIYRVIAFTIDLVVVIVPTLCVALVLCQLRIVDEDSPVPAVLVLALPVMLFSLSESRYGGGATFGKRLLRLAVVGKDHAGLPLYRAISRVLAKIGIPTVLLLGGFSIRNLSSFFAPVALGVLGIVLLPISVLFGSGLAGIHDRLVGSLVVSGDRGAVIEPVRDVRIYGWSVLAAVSISIALAILFTTSLWGPSGQIDWRSWERRGREMSTEFYPVLDEPELRHIKRYVKGIGVRPPDPLPESFEDSPTPVPKEIAQVLSAQQPLFELELRLTYEGFDSIAVREALLQRAVVFFSEAAAQNGGTRVVWVNMFAEDNLGILRFRRASRHIILVQTIEKDKAVRTALIEPKACCYNEIFAEVTGLFK